MRSSSLIAAELFYPMSNRAKVMTMTPPHTEGGGAAADLGFMAYHQGIPINDFRYLGTTETLRLDWDDPWFSKFDNRNVWRQYDSPVSAFLYVEHYEVRKEIVLRPRDLAPWLDLGLGGKNVISIEEQPEIKRRFVEFLSDKNPVTMVASKHEPLGGEIGFVSTCTWNVSGAVGHWGHVHTRENQYQARFVIKSVDGLWQITGLELLEQERLPG